MLFKKDPTLITFLSAFIVFGLRYLICLFALNEFWSRHLALFVGLLQTPEVLWILSA